MIINLKGYKMFKNLNEAQKEAVKKIDGPVLILAGAGSGKTKTIISRLTYLLEVKKIPPQSILTLTFTNKSAIEMKDKAINLINSSIIPYLPLICTFHKFSLIFLKKYIHTINRQNDFFIANSNNKKSILKKIIENENFDLSIDTISLEISKYKNLMIDGYQDTIKKDKNIEKIYKKYNKILIEKNLLDFDDLLILTYQILSTNQKILKEISSQYKYLMVDEYQDTNQIQSLIIKKITSTHKNLCVVGDDDQSIYGWRGANVGNILNFAKENKDCKIIKLELNYRSAKNILSCANRLIKHNHSRIDKKLIATKLGGKVKKMKFNNEKDEANYIIDKIKKMKVDNKNIAIIYRINSLNILLKKELNKKISLMSIHSSKGLEFDYLFVIGLENGIFPLLGNKSNIEEERRLAYVAFTRAKKELFLSYCKTRIYRGERRELTESSFLKECGCAIMIKDKRSFKIGDLIKHKIFGIGRVLNIQKEKQKYKLTINFNKIRKKIMDSFVEKI